MPSATVPRALCAAALVAALGLGPAPAQAQAQVEAQRDQSTRNLVLGLAALAALGFAIHERRDDRDEGREARRLPARCLERWPTSDGRVELYDPDCLEDRFEHAGRLPLSCAETVRSGGRFLTGFSPDCLAEEGWRVRRD